MGICSAVTTSVVSGRLARSIRHGTLKKVIKPLLSVSRHYLELLQVEIKKEEDVISRDSLTDDLESGYCSRRLSKISSFTGDVFPSLRSRSKSGDSMMSTSSTESTESMSLKKEYYVRIREEDLDDLGDESWIVIDMKVVEM